MYLRQLLGMNAVQARFEPPAGIAQGNLKVRRVYVCFKQITYYIHEFQQQAVYHNYNKLTECEKP